MTTHGVANALYWFWNSEKPKCSQATIHGVVRVFVKKTIVADATVPVLDLETKIFASDYPRCG